MFNKFDRIENDKLIICMLIYCFNKQLDNIIILGFHPPRPKSLMISENG